MAYVAGQNKAGCSSCNVDSAACAGGSSNIPKPQNGLMGYSHNGFQVQDYNGVVIQSETVVDGEFGVENYLKLLIDRPIPLFKQLMSKYSAVARLTFDIDMIYDNNNLSVDTPQIGFLKQFQHEGDLLSQDGKSFVYQEQAFEDIIAYVARDEGVATNKILLHDGNGTPIDLNNPKYRGLYEVGKKILIMSNGSSILAEDTPDCCANMISKTIVGINTVSWNGPNGVMNYSELELEQGDYAGDLFKGQNVAPNAVTASLNDEFGNVYKGDTVRSLFKPRNDCDTVTGDSNERGTSWKKTYIQHFGRVFEFKKSELNKSYASEKGVMSFILKRAGIHNRALMLELANAFYMAQNRSVSTISYYNPQSSKTETPGLETQGMIPMILEANYKYPEKRILTSMKNLHSPEEKAALIVDQLIQVQQSGAVDKSDTIVMLMDTKALSKYYQLNNAFTKLMGGVYQITDNRNKEFVEPILKTPYGTVEIMTCPVFEQLFGNSGNILYLPKKLIRVTQRENQAFVDKKIQKATMGFQITEITVPKLDGHECQYYNIYGEFAFIFGLVDSGAYRWIQNVS